MLFICGTRQNEQNCCKLGTVCKQITEISHSLEAHEHRLLAGPKRRPSSTLPPMSSWLMALPAQIQVCASHWQPIGEEPSTKVELLKYCLSLPTLHGLIDKKLHPDSFEPRNYFSQARGHLGNNTGCLCKSRQIAVHVCSQWWIPQRCCKT